MIVVIVIEAQPSMAISTIATKIATDFFKGLSMTQNQPLVGLQ